MEDAARPAWMATAKRELKFPFFVRKLLILGAATGTLVPVFAITVAYSVTAPLRSQLGKAHLPSRDRKGAVAREYVAELPISKSVGHRPKAYSTNKSGQWVKA
jgi:hypothetical protein